MELDEMEENYQRKKAALAAKNKPYSISGSAANTLGASGCALTKWQEHYMMYGCAGRGLILPEEWDDMI